LVDEIHTIFPAIYCSQEIEMPTSIGLLFLWKNDWNVLFPIGILAVIIL
jgi:hypothetical protein